MTEDLGLEQVLGQCGAVDYARFLVLFTALGAPRVVKPTSRTRLADAGLAQEENGRATGYSAQVVDLRERATRTGANI